MSSATYVVFVRFKNQRRSEPWQGLWWRRGIRKISDVPGISTGSIVSIIRAAYDENMGGLIDEARKELSGNFALMANTLMKRINYQTVSQASLKDMAIAAGIFADKAEKLGQLEAKPSPEIKQDGE